MLLTIFAQDLSALKVEMRRDGAEQERLNGESGAPSPGRSEPRSAPQSGGGFCPQLPPGLIDKLIIPNSFSRPVSPDHCH
jgi:hypothetical protein